LPVPVALKQCIRRFVTLGPLDRDGGVDAACDRTRFDRIVHLRRPGCEP
jgi:hypothetical protein